MIIQIVLNYRKTSNQKHKEQQRYDLFVQVIISSSSLQKIKAYSTTANLCSEGHYVKGTMVLADSGHGHCIAYS